MNKFHNKDRVFHKSTVKTGPSFYYDSIKQFFDGLKQPSEKTVRGAMIWSIFDPNCDTEYIIKAGGGSMSDHCFEALIKVDGKAIYKKYDNVFNDVLITEQELSQQIHSLIPSNEIIEDHIFGLVMITKKYVAGQLKKEVNWNDSFQSSYITQKELINRYKKQVRKAYDRKMEESSTTVEQYKKKYRIFKEETEQDLQKKVDFDKRKVELWNKILNFANNIEKQISQ